MKSMPQKRKQGSDHSSYSDWPQAEYDPHNTSNPKQSSLPINGITERWKRVFEGWATVNPLYADGILYLTTCHGTKENTYGYVRALDPKTGEDLWMQQLPTYATGGVAVADGTVYCGSSTGHAESEAEGSFVFAFDAASGNQQWKTPVQGGVRSPPTVVNGTVYIGSSDSDGRGLLSFDADTGATRWHAPTGGEILGSKPAVVDDVVYVGVREEGIAAYTTTDGAQKWLYPVDCHENAHFGGVCSSPAVLNNTVYVGGQDGAIHAINASSGQQVWSFETGHIIMGSPAVMDDTIIIGSCDGTVYALDQEQGECKWRFEAGPLIRASPIVIGDSILIGTKGKGKQIDDNDSEVNSKIPESSWFYQLNAKNGEVHWQTKVKGTVAGAPCFGNGVIYVGTWQDTSALYAFEPMD